MEADDLIGTTLGGCHITDLLGLGGMARVYRAYQTHLNREVAIKVLPPTYIAPNTIERFQREAIAMAQLRHPNIVTIYDAGEQNSWLYIVMEYIGGGTLRDRMQTAMPISDAVLIFHDIAEALTFVHDHGIIHRDVKPVNVLLHEVDGRTRAVLTDFGIAKILNLAAPLTRAGAGVGTPEYMSPEQCLGKPIDGRADVYALGILLYEMMCGRPPFQADDYATLANAHVHEAVPPPQQLNPSLSAPLQDVMLTALAKRPDQRYESARAMAKALEDALYITDISGRMTIVSRARAQVRCSVCGVMNPKRQNFCSSCGTPLHDSPLMLASSSGPLRTCRYCHSRNASNHHFCTRCGSPLI